MGTTPSHNMSAEMLISTTRREEMYNASEDTSYVATTDEVHSNLPTTSMASSFTSLVTSNVRRSSTYHFSSETAISTSHS